VLDPGLVIILELFWELDVGKKNSSAASENQYFMTHLVEYTFSIGVL